MFEAKTVHWSVYSKTDIRWTISGSYLGFVMDGMPKDEVEKKLKEKEAELKQKRPDDLMYTCMKE